MAILKHTPESSNIESMSFNPDKSICAVRFHSGKTYVHTGVTAEVWANWTKDWSAGKYYNHVIRRQAGKYPVVAIR